MYKIAKPLFLIAESPMHPGSGNALGVVDQPIQRESHTAFPKIEASSLKGSLRNSFDQNTSNSKDDIEAVFGPENGNDHAAALGFTDARLLLFPVKSMKGVFAWITCPAVLQRFQDDLTNSCADESFKIEELPGYLEEGEAVLTAKSDEITISSQVILEEYAFNCKQDYEIKIEDKSLAEWFSEKLFPNGNLWSEKLKSSLVIVSNDTFKDFVTMSTEVITRNKIDNTTGTASDTSLFTEEYLPSETVLYALVLTGRQMKQDGKEANEVMKFFEGHINNSGKVIQVGGNATLGKGITRLVIPNLKNNKES
ncbi:MAG: type III-B CRISPR module RAMP protein Cmr4 [Bacteroidota bacterium]